MSVCIDKNNCCGDKFCINICPAGCIEMDSDNKAELTRKGILTCISCGQCIAVCPKNAIELEIDGKAEQGEPITASYPSFDEIANMIKTRRSVRKFKNKDISEEEILKALDIVRFAPTAKNKQYVEWVVVNGKDKVRRLAGLVIDYMRTVPSAKRIVASYDQGEDPIFREAPCVIFAYCDKTAGERYGTVDCSIAATYLELLLPSMGIGACWAGFAVSTAQIYAPINEFLGLKESDEIKAGFMLGYQQVKYKKVPPRQKAKVKFI